MSGWRDSPLAAILAICVFVAAQLAIPLTRIGEPERAQRFGWQMFSTYVRAPQFTVETGDGSVDIDLEDYMARPRADIDIVGPMPAHLCETIPNAVRVAWDGGSHPC